MSTLITLDQSQIKNAVQKILEALDALSRRTVNPGGDEDLREHLFNTRKPINALMVGWEGDYTDEERRGYLKIAIDHHIIPMLNRADQLAAKGNWQYDVQRSMEALQARIRTLRNQLP